MSRTMRQVQAFGWTFGHCKLADGAMQPFHAPVAVSAAERGWCAMWTRGRATMTGQPDRVAGHFTATDLPVTQAGEYELRAIEDCEWYCLDARLNDGRRPTTLRPVRIEAGDVQAFPVGRRLFIVGGTFLLPGAAQMHKAPAALVGETGVLSVRAMSNVYGFDLGEED